MAAWASLLGTSAWSKPAKSVSKLDKALIKAVQSGDLAKVKKLVGQGADVNVEADSYQGDFEGGGNTLLHLATVPGKEDIARFLIKAGAIVDVANSEHNTPLHWAAMKGNLEVVKLLVKAGANVNAKGGFDATPLHMAMGYKKGHYPAVVAYLLKVGANPNARATMNYTPLMAGTGVAGYFQLLGEWEDEAAAFGALLSGGADINALDEIGRTALHQAASNGNNLIVSILLQAGLDPNKISLIDTPLVSVSAAGDLDRFNLYNPNKLAIESIIDDLVEYGADINRTGFSGSTALHIAASSGNEEAVVTLLSYSAKIDARSDEGETPLHAAASDYENRYGGANTIPLLFQAHADLNAKTHGGKTPLHLAVEANNLAAVAMLLGLGAEVNPKDKKGRTPMAYALQKKYTAIAKVLKLHGGRI